MRRLLSILLLWPFALAAQDQTISVSFPIVISGTASAPTFSPTAGSVTNPTTITASTSTTGCGSYIYFDTNSTPTTNQTTYSVTTAVTLYAYVHGCPGHLDSSVSSAAYTITAAATPTFSPVAGAVSNPTTVTASTATSDGCTMYFDTSNPPTTAQSTYSVTTGVTLYAQAKGCTHHANSAVASAAYTVCAYQMCDTFTGVASTNLASHTADSGQSWGQFYVEESLTLNGSNGVVGTAYSAFIAYYANFTPSSANYTVSVPCTLSSGTNEYCSVFARIASFAVNTTDLYECRFQQGLGVTLNVVSGNQSRTQIGTTYSGVTTGTITLATQVNGTSISCLVNGSGVSGPSGTDSTYTAAGYAGIGMNNRGTTASVTFNQTFTVQ